MEPTERHRLGRTKVEVTRLGFGGAPMGGTGGPVDDGVASSTLAAAWEAGIRYFDTAPWYGRGLSELRLGRLLQDRPRQDFVLSTKVGRILRAPVNAQPPLPNQSGQMGGLPFEV